MNLPHTFNRLFQLGWPGLSVAADHRGQVSLVELTRAGGETLDTYTAAELDAGQTLGLYEQMHTQALRAGLRVTLTSDPARHPDYRHSVTVAGGHRAVSGEGMDPLTALLRALLEYQRLNRDTGLLGRLRRRLAA